MVDKDFSEYVKGKTFNEILHEGRRESADRILSEALIPLTLLLSRELLNVLLISPQALEGLNLSTVPSTSHGAEPVEASGRQLQAGVVSTVEKA
jgi:hypothetical protein